MECPTLVISRPVCLLDTVPVLILDDLLELANRRQTNKVQAYEPACGG